MTNCDSNVLAGLPLFQGLTSRQLLIVMKTISCGSVPAGLNVLSLGQHSDMVYIILRGSVKVYIERPERTNMILNVLGPGEVIGELSAIDGLGHSASVVTLETTHFAWMNQADLVLLLNALPVVSVNLVRILSKRLRRLTGQAEMLATADVNGRVARQISVLAQDYGEPVGDGRTLIPLKLRQADIASLVGASREKVNRALNHFKRQNIISLGSDHRIVVIKQDVLEKFYV